MESLQRKRPRTGHAATLLLERRCLMPQLFAKSRREPRRFIQYRGNSTAWKYGVDVRSNRFP